MNVKVGRVLVGCGLSMLSAMVWTSVEVVTVAMVGGYMGVWCLGIDSGRGPCGCAGLIAARSRCADQFAVRQFTVQKS